MTTAKGITEVQALEAAIAGNLTDEVIAKLQKMLDTRKKPRTRKADTSKRDANVALGEDFADAFEDAFPEGATFTAADVAEVLEISKQKASAVCKAMGWETVPTTEKVKVYTL